MKSIFTIIFVCLAGISFAQTPKDNVVFNSLKNEKDTSLLKKKIDGFSNSNNESEVTSVVQYYIGLLKLAKADSLALVSAKRFPQGKYAFKLALSNLNRQADPIDQEAALEKIRNDFPDKTGTNELDLTNGTIALNFAKHNSTAKALKYLSLTLDRGRFVLPIVNEFLKYDMKAAAELLDRTIVGLKEGARIQSVPIPKNSQLFRFQIIYSGVLLKLGKPEQALAQAKEVYDELKPASAGEVTITYATALAASQQYKRALPFLEEVVSEGKSNDAIDSLLMNVYEKVNVGKDAKRHLDSLRQVLITKKNIETKNKLLNLPCPNFVVTDENGKKVTLADFKGKTIILDFWATWCGPCKASFPAMQMVVNQYLKDPNVKFLFIHTCESSKTPQKDAVEFLKANNFSLPLYMDLKDPATNKSPAISLFDVQGIPTKFIVDGQGQIRFKLTGFEGGMDGAHAAEVSAMIDIAKKTSL
ncbi:MAG: redoxin domain-containing protein [Bacteroidota bacterium]